MTRLFAAVICLLLWAGPAGAQEVSPAIKFGKWFLLAGSIGMNLLAAHSHDLADEAFDALETSCNAAHERCALGPDGSYVDPEIESLYQTSVQYDQEARYWLVGGETALAGAAALFIWELARPKTRPDNIPFEPEVRSMRGGSLGLGVRAAF